MKANTSAKVFILVPNLLIQDNGMNMSGASLIVA